MENGEGQHKIILSSDLEKRASREEREEQEKKEQKEQLKLKEKLDLAVKELKGIIGELPKDGRDLKRARHTLRSVEYALEKLGKDGAPAGKYAVEVKNKPGNPQEAYTQYEGVPVDELIGILRQKSKDINQNLPTKKTLGEMKKKSEELWQEYQKANAMGLSDNDKHKHTLYSEWEQSKKAYEESEQAYEKGYFEKAKDLSDLADELYKNSKTYFERHYTKAHGEDGNVWTQEEKNKQDLRTRHESHLVEADYRKTGSEEGDYKASMEILKHRRELVLEEEEEKAPEPVPEPVIEPEGPLFGPENGPIFGPQEGPKNPKGPPMRERVSVVSAEAQAEFMANKRGTERLNKMLNHQSKLKKWWYKSWEQGYRTQLIAEERKKILGKENKAGWLRRKLFGAQSFEATGKKNLFEGTGKESEHKEEMTALANRFTEGYIRNSEGEEKEQLKDPEFNQRLTKLVEDYGSSAMPDADFDVQADLLIADIAKKYPESFAAGELTANNFLEAAKEFRKSYVHSQGTARLDKGLEIDLGLAKQAIKTKANIGFFDKAISGLQKYPVLGHAFTPEGAGFLISLGSYFSKKPAYWLGGAAGAGGLLGAMRRNTEQKRDLEAHRIERALGSEKADYAGLKNRERAESWVYEMKKSTDIQAEINNLSQAFEASPTPENAQALTAAVADAEARMSLDEERGRDLIQFEGETLLERGRLYLLKPLAEAKVKLQKAGFDSNIPASHVYKDRLAELSGQMDKIDKSERNARWKENAKAAVWGAVKGLVIGGLTQEAFAKIGDNVHALSWLRPGGKATSLEKLADYTGLNNKAGFGWLGHGMYEPSGGSLFEALHYGNGRVKIDSTTELVANRSGGGFVLRDAGDHTTVLAKMDIDPSTGRLTPVPGSYDPKVIEFHAGHAVPGSGRTVSEWMDPSKSHFGKGVNLETWHTVGHLANNTPMPQVDFNELRFYMQFDSAGNLTLDPSKIQEYLENNVGEQVQGSRTGDKILEVMDAFKNGKLQIGISANPLKPTEVLALTLDPGTNKFVVQGGGANDLMAAFGRDASGHPVYKGQGYMGLGHILATRADGSKDVEWVNAIRGNDEEITTKNNDEILSEITRNKPKEWWGPFITYFRRKALENKKDKQHEEKIDENEKKGIISTGGKKLDFKVDFFEEPDEKEDSKKKLVGKKFKKKVVVDTRGQKIEKDRKDWEKDYPVKRPLKDEKQAAEYLMNKLKPGGQFYMNSEDLGTFSALDFAGKQKFLEEKIKQDRKVLKYPDGQEVNANEWGALNQVVLKQVNEELELYGKEGRSELPEAGRIHILGLYEYQAQAEASGKSSLGVCYTDAGEIYVNFDLLKQVCPTMEEFIPQLKRTVAHEVLHGSVANNYWAYEAEDAGDGDEEFIPRRTGIKFVRRDSKSSGSIVERGRALNEAVTETLSKNITDKIYESENWPKPKYTQEPYTAERNVLALLQEKYKIPFETFAKAVVNRKKLRELAVALDGKAKEGKVERPQFMSLLMTIMDFEHQRQKYDYTKTKQLIGGVRGVTISREMKIYFPASLLDKNGNIKESLVDLYGLVDEEAVAKLPKKAVA